MTAPRDYVPATRADLLPGAVFVYRPAYGKPGRPQSERFRCVYDDGSKIPQFQPVDGGAALWIPLDTLTVHTPGRASEPATSHAAAAAEIAALRNQVAMLLAAQAWRPIATAPRDGSDVLLATDDRGDYGKAEPTIGYWRPEYNCWATLSGDDEESEKYGPHWWMPLPQVPKVQP